jgi:WD40 repeat protein
MEVNVTYELNRQWFLRGKNSILLSKQFTQHNHYPEFKASSPFFITTRSNWNENPSIHHLSTFQLLECYFKFPRFSTQFSICFSLSYFSSRLISENLLKKNTPTEIGYSMRNSTLTSTFLFHPRKDARMSQQAHHGLHVPRFMQFSRNRFVIRRRLTTTLIDFSSEFQPVTVPRVRTSQSGTRYCRRRRRWLHVREIVGEVIEGKSFNDFWTFAAFACHDQGASSLAFAPQHQLLISAGKKGDVCIFDVRQRTLRHRFQVRRWGKWLGGEANEVLDSQAHDNAIKCLAMDPHEEFFVTGSADGDIKVRMTDQIVWEDKSHLKNRLIRKTSFSS